MKTLASRWGILTLAVVAVVAAIGIQAFEPDYNKLQTAKDADAFRGYLHSTGRATGAAFADIVFAAAYGLLGVAAFRALAGKTAFAITGSVLIAAGAAFDELENALLLRNIRNHESLDTNALDTMHIPGTLKWIGGPGVLLLLGLLIARAIRRGRRS